MSIKEIPVSAIDAKTQQILSGFIPQEDVPLVICHNSDPPSLYVLTKRRVARIALTTSQYNVTIVTHFKDVVSIREFSIPGSLFGTSGYGISLYGHDSQQAIVGFRFSSKDELYSRFNKILKEGYENASVSQESENIESGHRSTIERMSKLEQLFKSGRITEVEYKQKREEIIRDL